MRSAETPKRASSFDSPMWPSLSEFHCDITTTARPRPLRVPSGDSPSAGNQRPTTVLFSGWGVTSALGKRSVPASPPFRSSGDASVKE